MTEIEKVLYAIMDSMGNLPVVFKGAMVTNAITQDASTHRHTKDIDINWVGDSVSMHQLCEKIQASIVEAGMDYEVKPFRDYSNNRSAGLYILKDGVKIGKMDIDMKEYKGNTQIYKVGEIEFKGVAVEQIIGDKISALSGDKAFRRAKDIVDLQAITSTTKFSLADVKKYIDINSRQIGEFTSLFDEDRMRHAYDKLEGVDNKLTYDEVMMQVRTITEPFRNKGGDIWVRPHYRRGKPVKGHWRRKKGYR